MTQLGPYRLEVVLGRGGMGQVHRAFDTRRDRVVAVKVLLADLADDADFRTRFARECQTVARLREPHVIPIHDFGEIDGRLYLDMRLVDGVDLGTVLGDGPLSVAEAVDVTAQVAAALDAAHDAGLVHRDVKPGNVLLSGAGDGQRVGFAYLFDFGIARSDAHTSSGATTTGLVGTVAYMAPERIAGEVDDARGDVYSLACVLYESLAGQPPFQGDTYQVLFKQVNTAAPRLDTLVGDSVPRELADVLERGLAKNPDDRFPSAGALAAAARSALVDAAAGSTTPLAGSPSVTAAPTEPFASSVPTALDLPRSQPPSTDAPGSESDPPVDAPHGATEESPGGPRRRPRARWFAAAGIAAVLAAGCVTAVGLWGGSGRPAAAGPSPTSEPSTTSTCDVGAGPDAPTGCDLTAAERRLGARIPTRFGLSTCVGRTAATATAVPAVTADVACYVSDTAAPAEQVEAVSFTSDQDLQLYLAHNLYSFDFAGLPVGKCAVNGVSNAREPLPAVAPSAVRYCATNDNGYAVVAWTYPSERVVLLAATTPNHVATTIPALVRWVWSGSLTLG
ncbi:serine/threonine-protein kinase [Jatrophihabitans sp. YIM 134969]